MAGEVMLINPARRKRNAKGRFVKSKRKTTSRKRRTYRRNPSRVTVAAAPRRRRRSVARKSPVRRRRTYRRNPSARMSVRSILGSVQDAAMGAGGSLLTDAAFTYIPLPAIAKGGNIGLVTRAAMAFGVGWLSSFVLGGARAKKLTEGALTVQIANLAKAQISSRFLPLAGDEELGYMSAGMIGEYLSGGPESFGAPAGAPALGEYLSAYGDEREMILADEYSY